MHLSNVAVYFVDDYFGSICFEDLARTEKKFRVRNIAEMISFLEFVTTALVQSKRNGIKTATAKAALHARDE